MIRLWAFIAILITIIHGPYHNFEHWARYNIVTGPIISHAGMGAPEFILVSAAPHWTLWTVSQDSWHLSEAGGQVSSSGWQPASGRSRWSLTWLCVTGPSVDLYQHPEYQGKIISHKMITTWISTWKLRAVRKCSAASLYALRLTQDMPRLYLQRMKPGLCLEELS